MAEDLGERTEMPTTRRRTEARQEGRVAKSQDLNSALDLTVAFFLILIIGSWLIGGLLAMLRSLLGPDAFLPSTTVSALFQPGRWTALRSSMLIAPVLVAMFVFIVLTRVVQVGWVITAKPVQPRLDRMDPVNGMKRLFSKRSLVQTLVNTGKLALVGTTVILLVKNDYPKMAALALLEAHQAFVAMGRMLIEMVLWLLAILIIIGLIDFAYQRWQHTQDLKMTKQEVKDERKMMEGDMEMKARRRRMARSMILQQLRQAVPTADVVVTNPTHFSVALRYDSESMAAPKVVAKGADYLAFRIREIAQAHNIPIVERPDVARAVYASVEVGQPINPEFYEAVAEILAYVYRLEGRAA